ncbi:MAG TPA: MFS transporter [Dehalococcoidia bacterium]
MAGQPLRPGAPAAPQDSVLRNTKFLRLWLAQAVSQTGQNGLFFVLLVVVTEETRSAVSGSVLVLTFVLPSVLLSLVAGVLVDRWHKRTVLIVTNLLRGGVCLLFIPLHTTVGVVFALNLLFSSISQFFGPAEAATIPALVERRHLISANGLFNLTLTGSQFTGIVLLAPLLLKLGGPNLFFAVAFCSYSAAALLAASLPRGIEPPLARERVRGLALARGVAREFAEGLRVIRADRLSLLALVDLTMGSFLTMLFALLVPRFMQEILRTGADNAVFVFAPTGVGALVGLRLLPWFGARLRKPHIVAAGLGGITLSLLLLGSVEPIARLLEGTGPGGVFSREQPFGLSVLTAVTMVFAFPMGVSYALVNAPAQTIIHERAPRQMRARFFGTQIALANLTSLGPLLLLGAVTDLLGVAAVLYLLAPVVAAVAALGLVLARGGESPPAEPEGGPGAWARNRGEAAPPERPAVAESGRDGASSGR